MRTRDLFYTASRGVGVNKIRSALTMLGIIIGVGAVVLMTGIGESMQGVILEQVSILGPNTIAMWPGNQGPEGGNASLRPGYDSLTASDVNALMKLDSISSVAPLMFVPGKGTYGTETMDPRTVGALPEYYGNQNVEVAAGRLHDEADERAVASVAVIGSDVAENLFGNEDPVGRRMGIGDRKFTVIGVLKPVGTQFLQNVDERIIIPLSAAHAVTGRTYYDMVTAQAVGDSELAVQDVTAFLRKRHSIIPAKDGSTENDDFLVRSAVQAREILGSVSLGLTLFITVIAAVSLIVGGIGIMNVMLVAVKERTREIGLRKALGAKRADILHQFLVESVILTLIGGIIGLAIGFLLMLVVAVVAGRCLDDYRFTVNVFSVVLALAMAGVTGAVFGVYPARQAAKLDPIDALRYE